MSTRGISYFRQRAIEQLHEAQASTSADLRSLHVRWANFYSDQLAQMNAGESPSDSPQGW